MFSSGYGAGGYGAGGYGDSGHGAGDYGAGKDLLDRIAAEIGRKIREDVNEIPFSRELRTLTRDGGFEDRMFPNSQVFGRQFDEDATRQPFWADRARPARRTYLN